MLNRFSFSFIFILYFCCHWWVFCKTLASGPWNCLSFLPPTLPCSPHNCSFTFVFPLSKCLKQQVDGVLRVLITIFSSHTGKGILISGTANWRAPFFFFARFLWLSEYSNMLISHFNSFIYWKNSFKKKVEMGGAGSALYLS